VLWEAEGAYGGGPVTLVSPMIARYPLVTPGMSRLPLRSDRPDARILLGVAVTVGGIVLLLVGG
jgi:drug/metabolite transporter (DMT)-like permease